MRIDVNKRLFAWDCLDDSPSLKTIRDFLAAIPDAKLLEDLRLRRGKGRNDYPVRHLWGALLLTFALRHASIEACLAELRRNEGVRRLIGIDSEDQVPKSWNMSRFLDVLGREPHRDEMGAIPFCARHFPVKTSITRRFPSRVQVEGSSPSRSNASPDASRSA
jgi:hypothetical protein